MVKVRQRALHVLIFCLIFADGARGTAIASCAHQPSERKAAAVTIDAILQRRSARLSEVHWYDERHLIASMRLPDGAQDCIRLMGLDGQMSKPQAVGAGVVSPDRRTQLLQVDAGWQLTDVKSGSMVSIASPEDQRKFDRIRSPVWSRDSRFVAFVEVYQYVGPDTRVPVVVDEVPIVDLGATAASRQKILSRITLIDRQQPDHVKHVMLDDLAYDVDWGIDGILFVTRIAFRVDDPYTEILAIDRTDRPLRTVFKTRGRFQSMTPHVSPDGQTIAVAFDVDNRNWDDFTSLVLIDVKSGKETRVTSDLPVYGAQLSWSHDGSRIYASARGGGLSQLWEIPLRGKPIALTSGLRRHFNLELSPGGRKLLFETEDGYGRHDIRVLDLRSRRESVVFVVDEPAKDFALGEWRHIRWNSTDGVRPYGYVFLPPEFESKCRYPMFVDIHGGGFGSRLFLDAPLTAGVAPGPLEWHAWAALGYVVFVPDYRSTGDYGPQVITARLRSGKHDPLDDVPDIVSGVQYMIAQGYIDPSRIAVFGHSAGGPRAYNAVASSPGLFAAAIINDGSPPDPLFATIRLLSGKYTGANSMGILEDQFGATMAEAPERYRVNTTFDAARIKTPMLIMMGAEDRGGTGLQPWEVIFSILRSQNVPARMLIFADEGHVHATPASGRLAFKEAQQWLRTQMP